MTDFEKFKGLGGDRDSVHSSWLAPGFDFVEPSDANGDVGLRKPQRAALFACLGHLVSNGEEPATIVMPTGTGKTDTIAALIVAGRFKRTLVLVPSDILRRQTKVKLERLEKLREMGAVPSSYLNPFVGVISGGLEDNEVEAYEKFNIIVATPHALHRFSDSAVEKLATICSHLIVDEAHHVAARTWGRIKRAFDKKSCLQFTATPFREDGQSLGGRIIYNYPLLEARNDQYFQGIEFHPVREYRPSESDKAIADTAL